jgi:hypothetical protein
LFARSASAEITIQYSTYLGGGGRDFTRGLAFDPEGRACLMGYTTSDDFPTANPYQPFRAGLANRYDVCVSLFSSSGSSLVYSTYLGGSGNDEGYGFALSSDGRICVAGYTESADLPTHNPYQASFGGGTADGFTACLSSSGSALLFLTYLGGGDFDGLVGLALGSDGRAHVTGSSASSDFPTLNAYQAARRGNGQDIVVASLASDGSALVYSTYLGGSGDDGGSAAALTAEGEVLITGPTASDDFPTQNPFQANFGGAMDAFVARLSSSGSSLLYSTYLGGSGSDGGFGLSPVSDGRVYFIGYTASTDFPLSNPCQPSYGGGDWDGVVALLSSSGSALVHSTYLGGDGADYGMGLLIDRDGSAAVAGITSSLDFPTLNPYQAGYGGGTWDAFITLYAPSGSSLLFSTYLGGIGLDQGARIEQDSSGRYWVAGNTASIDFPTVQPYQATFGGGDRDLFLAVLGFAVPTPVPVIHPVADDYTGDGVAEFAIFRPDEGLWAVRALGRTRFGRDGDLPVSGDYGGWGVAAAAIFRPANGLWAVKDCTRVNFGQDGDLPVRGDFNDDGRDDFAVFRPPEGLWAVLAATRFNFGAAGDIPIAADFSGDGLPDFAVFRPADGLWAVREFTRFYLGAEGDIPVPGIFGWYVPFNRQSPFRCQAAVFRSAAGMWAVRGVTRFYLGRDGDIPQAEDFSGNNLVEGAVFRPTNGLWAVRGLTRLYFGAR